MPWESQLLAELGLGRADVSAYVDAVERAGVARACGAHRLLGYPDQFNGDVQLQCPYVARGLRVRDPRYDQRLHRAFARESGDWRLLLQVDSLDEIGMDFFMGSRVFFCIRGGDFAARRFHRAAATSQR